MDERTRGYLFEDQGRVVRGELSRGRIVRIPYILMLHGGEQNVSTAGLHQSVKI